MKVIVGLGNVGQQYESTPHNLGFRAVDTLAARAGIRVTRPESQALVGIGKIAGQEAALAKPQTMMNRSGSSVRALLERYESGPGDLIVLIDEMDLPWGMLRIRETGHNSTHNGLKSVIAALGTDRFIRVRLGVAPEKIWGDRKDYLLRDVSREERSIADEMVVEAADAVELILTAGADKAMSRFNRRNSPPASEGPE